MKLHARFLTLASLTVGLTLHAASTWADTFDWNAITYAPATAMAAQTKTILGTTAGGNTISLQFTLNNGATFTPAATLPSPVSASYADNTGYVSGGGSTTQRSPPARSMTGGNFRLLNRLLTQIERVLKLNNAQTISPDIVDAARESLVIGQA